MSRNGTSETVWRFKTRQFEVCLSIMPVYGYQYDGDDEDGSTQAMLDSGDYVAFDSSVSVIWNGETIGADHLGSSVYAVATISEFWTAHRDANPMARNCTIYRKAKGGHEDARVCICHYFPGMVSEAIREARAHLRSLPAVPYIRAGA